MGGALGPPASTIRGVLGGPWAPPIAIATATDWHGPRLHQVPVVLAAPVRRGEHVVRERDPAEDGLDLRLEGAELLAEVLVRVKVGRQGVVGGLDLLLVGVHVDVEELVIGQLVEAVEEVEDAALPLHLDLRGLVQLGGIEAVGGRGPGGVGSLPACDVGHQLERAEEGEAIEHRGHLARRHPGDQRQVVLVEHRVDAREQVRLGRREAEGLTLVPRQEPGNAGHGGWDAPPGAPWRVYRESLAVCNAVTMGLARSGWARRGRARRRARRRFARRARPRGGPSDRARPARGPRAGPSPCRCGGSGWSDRAPWSRPPPRRRGRGRCARHPTATSASAPKRRHVREGTREGRSMRNPTTRPARSSRAMAAAGAGPSPVDGSHAPRRPEAVVQAGEARIVALASHRRDREALGREHGGEPLPGAQVGGDEDHPAPFGQGLAEGLPPRGIEGQRASGGLGGIEERERVREHGARRPEGGADAVRRGRVAEARSEARAAEGALARQHQPGQHRERPAEDRHGASGEAGDDRQRGADDGVQGVVLEALAARPRAAGAEVSARHPRGCRR